MTDETTESGAGEQEAVLAARIERAEALIDTWEHDAPNLIEPVFIGRLREVLRRDPAPVRLRGAATPDADDASEHVQFTDESGTWCRKDCPRPEGECGALAVEQSAASTDASSASLRTAVSGSEERATSSGALSEADVEVLAEELWADSTSPGAAPTDSDRDLARRILASDWLAARESAAATRARAEERERIARAIEEAARHAFTSAEERHLRDAARIARGDA